MIYGYVFTKRKIREFRLWLWWNLLGVRILFRRVGKVPTVRATRKILSEFCAEAAVLIAVFPYLDFLIENYRTSQPKIDMGPVKRLSAMICVISLIMSIFLAVKTDEKE